MIDIGSNSARIVVVEREAFGHVAVVEEERVALQLGRAIAPDGAIAPHAIEATLATLQRFRSLAEGAGAQHIEPVATAAIREATNGEALLRRIYDVTGLHIRILSGEEEAQFAALGAVHGLDADHGIVIDIGGGSFELASVHDRAIEKSWTFPLGALRASDTFLRSDPPKGGELRELREAVASALAAAGIPSLDNGDALVGTGGTIRNLAKIDRRPLNYPIRRLHGYVLEATSLDDIVRRLAGESLHNRAGVPGLNPDRADSIVGGAVVLQATMAAVGANRVIVAGQGIREGVLLGSPDARVAPANAVRAASVEALARRFRGWQPDRAHQRASAAGTLLPVLAPGLPLHLAELMEYASAIIDIGAFVDFYNRARHTANIIIDSDLIGFTHRQLGLLAALVRLTDRDSSSIDAYTPLVTRDDAAELDRAAAVIAVAEEIQRHTPPSVPVRVAPRRTGDQVVVVAPFAPIPAPAALVRRARASLGVELEFERPETF